MNNENKEWVAITIQFFGLGWEAAAIAGGLSTGLWAIGFVVWLVGASLWWGVNL